MLSLLESLVLIATLCGIGFAVWYFVFRDDDENESTVSGTESEENPAGNTKSTSDGGTDLMAIIIGSVSGAILLVIAAVVISRYRSKKKVDEAKKTLFPKEPKTIEEDTQDEQPLSAPTPMREIQPDPPKAPEQTLFTQLQGLLSIIQHTSKDKEREASKSTFLSLLQGHEKDMAHPLYSVLPLEAMGDAVHIVEAVENGAKNGLEMQEKHVKDYGSFVSKLSFDLAAGKNVYRPEKQTSLRF